MRSTELNPIKSRDHLAGLGGGLAAGVATSIALWIMWWVGHLPAIDAPRAPLIGLLALTQGLSLLMWSAWSGRRNAFHVGLIGGATSAALNLLLLGSKLVEQPTSFEGLAEQGTQLRPGAVLVILGYLTASLALGAVAGLAGRAMARRIDGPSPAATLAALAAVGAVAFAPLLVVGGAVTSSESGMAVPDAVTTYGSVSFLFPLSLMAGEWGEPKVFLEHTHRLFGSLVGLVTLLVAAWTWRIERREHVRFLALAVFLLVTTQGILGALRVSENSAVLAMLHGMFGQAVFASAVLLAAVLAASARQSESTIPGPTLRAARVGFKLSVAAIACVGLQLAFGAASRHLGADHATWSHAVFAFVVAAVVVSTGLALRSSDRLSASGRRLRFIGALLVAGISVQFLLGFVVLWQVSEPEAQRPIVEAGEFARAIPVDLLEASVATLHQAIGAAILGLCTLAVFWSSRWTKAREVRLSQIASPRTSIA